MPGARRVKPAFAAAIRCRKLPVTPLHAWLRFDTLDGRTRHRRSDRREPCEGTAVGLIPLLSQRLVSVDDETSFRPARPAPSPRVAEGTLHANPSKPTRPEADFDRA